MRLVPIAVALVLWVARRRGWFGRDDALAAAAVWCAVSLVAKQAVLVAETGGRLEGGAALLSVLLALGPAAVVMTAVEPNRRPWLLWLVAFAGTAVTTADLLYARYFGDLLSTPALLALGQSAQVFDSAASLVEPRDAWLVADLVAALPLLRRAGRQPSRPRASRRVGARLALAAAVTAGVAAIGTWMSQAVPAQVFSNLAVARQLGPFGFHAYDAWSHATSRWLRRPLSAAELDEVRTWFAGRRALRSGSGPHFGVAAGRNVVVVQVESLQGFVIGLRIGEQEVTPNLNRWWAEGVGFSSVTDQTGEGRTSDAEFAALTSLLPLDQGAVAFRYPANGYVGMPDVLRKLGYTTLAAVPFDGAFWNRSLTLPGYGFSHTLFADAFEPGPAVGWGLNDRDFLRQMARRLAAMPRPFMAWLITLSNHFPYDEFPDELKVLDTGEWADTSFGNYLHGMRHLDAALGDLHQALERDGLWHETVVVVLGDHDAGLPWENRIARTAGFEAGVINWHLEDRVPWLVLAPGIETLRGPQTMSAGLVDLAPTLLALLGVDAAPLPFVGRNLLTAAVDDVRVRPHGSWVNGQYFFDAEAESPARRCYDVATRQNVEIAACDRGSAEAALVRRISARVVTHGLQATLAP